MPTTTKAVKPHKATEERWFDTFQEWAPDRREKAIFAAQQVHAALLRVEARAVVREPIASPEDDMEQARRRAPLDPSECAPRQSDAERWSGRQRVYGSTMCLGCNMPVDVVYPYTNSDNALGLIDHESEPGVRCIHAGLSVWTKEHGWSQHRVHGRYGKDSIVALTEDVSEFPVPSQEVTQ